MLILHWGEWSLSQGTRDARLGNPGQDAIQQNEQVRTLFTDGNQHHMSQGRKPEYSEEMHEASGELHTHTVEAGTPAVQGKHANH